MNTARIRSMTLTGAILLLVPRLAAPADVRSYAGGNYAVEIQGIPSFWLKSVEGGFATAPAVARGQRPDKYPEKESGTIKYEDAKIQLALQAPKAVWDWASTFASPQGAPAKQVTLSILDSNGTDKGHRTLDNSTISLVELPGCDGSGKDPGYATIGLAPGGIREAAGSGGKPPTTSKEKAWIPANFRLSIDGLDATRVSKIDPITIKRSPNGPDYSNLKVTIPEANADTWKQWAALVFSGGDKAKMAGKIEKNGRLEFLSPTLKETLLTLNFEGLGIVQIAPEKAEANNDAARRLVVELYVEKITIVGAANPQ